VKGREVQAFPRTSQLRQRNTHRLVPAKYSDPQRPLQEIADTAAQLRDLVDLDSASDEAMLTQSGLQPAISPHELATGVPHARIINAAFIHAHPGGSRFNSATRGAWYAAFQLSTAQAEVAFHRAVHLAEVSRFDDEVEFDDYLADFAGEFHDMRRTRRFDACLAPASYVASQVLAEQLLEIGSLGVIYPSVRRARGTCLACFDPKNVNNVRQAGRFRFTWRGRPTPQISEAKAGRARVRPK
jgi:RES domain-containing protein